MTTYDFADVLLVPFPFTNQSTTKKRPTVVISSGSYNTVRPDLILIAVTSQITSPLLFGELEITDWQNAGLLKGHQASCNHACKRADPPEARQAPGP